MVFIQARICMICSGRAWEGGGPRRIQRKKQLQKQQKMQIDIRRNLIEFFYSERRVIMIPMGQTCKEINNTDNAVKNLIRSVTNRFILRKFCHGITRKY